MKKVSFGKNLFGDVTKQNKPGAIADSFLMLPSTVLSARDGWWQKRKRAWIKLGIKSEVGRDVIPGGGGPNSAMHRTTGKYSVPKKQRLAPGGGGGGCWLGGKKTKTSKEFGHIGESGSGTSIFDPVLTELVYRWFCPEGGQVVDPFAGGSVRGIVAQMLGRKYWGCELRGVQVEANREQGQLICSGTEPLWVQGDSYTQLPQAPEADLIFSCPPYGDLEVYSDDPADLSNMPFKEFMENYERIVKRACLQLKYNRFAAWVVGDYRCKEGHYRNFVARTISCFLKAGLQLWNHAILVTAIGSIPIRIPYQFRHSRKLAKNHQDLLVFVKGDGIKATEACGKIQTGW